MSARANPIEILNEKHWWQIAVRGFIALIFGILVLAWPGVSLFILAIIFGAYVFVDGIFTLVAALTTKPAPEGVPGYLSGASSASLSVSLHFSGQRLQS